MNTSGHLRCRKDILFKCNAECLEKVFHWNIMQNWWVYDMTMESGCLGHWCHCGMAGRWTAGAGVAIRFPLMRESQLDFLLGPCPLWSGTHRRTCAISYCPNLWQRSPGTRHIWGLGCSAWFVSDLLLCPHSAPPSHIRGSMSGCFANVGSWGEWIPFNPMMLGNSVSDTVWKNCMSHWEAFVAQLPAFSSHLLAQTSCTLWISVFSRFVSQAICLKINIRS